MGGLPVTAMNIVGVPLEHLSLEDVNLILKGGADKVAEAGCVLAGGHTVQNPEPLYGLSVTGLVHPDRLITNAGAEVGDLLVLTKPLGTGILSTATKRGIEIGDLAHRSVSLMATLNTPGAGLGRAGLVFFGSRRNESPARYLLETDHAGHSCAAPLTPALSPFMLLTIGVENSSLKTY